MSDTIIIPLEQPVVIPSVAAKEFTARYLTQILVRPKLVADENGTLFPSMEGGSVLIEYLPMIPSTGELLPKTQSVSTELLMEAAAEVPEVKQAMGAILLAVQPLEAWLKSRQGS